jgi:hypothetical protein
MSPKRHQTLRPALAEMERVIIEAELHLIRSLEDLKQCEAMGTEIAVARHMMQVADERVATLHSFREEMLSSAAPQAAAAPSPRRSVLHHYRKAAAWAALLLHRYRQGVRAPHLTSSVWQLTTNSAQSPHAHELLPPPAAGCRKKGISDIRRISSRA